MRSFSASICSCPGTIRIEKNRSHSSELLQIPATANVSLPSGENHVRGMRPASPAASAQALSGTMQRRLTKLARQKREPRFSVRVLLTGLSLSALPSRELKDTRGNPHVIAVSSPCASTNPASVGATTSAKFAVTSTSSSNSAATALAGPALATDAAGCSCAVASPEMGAGGRRRRSKKKAGHMSRLDKFFGRGCLKGPRHMPGGA